ncbi:MAG: methyltransferase family protein [Aeromicrobium sp.]
MGVALFALLGGGATRRFARAGTAVIPFRPSTALVTTGPFRFTRNPMYLGMAVLQAGLSLAFGLMWALAMVPVAVLAVDRLVIAREEPYLERRFGADYIAYKSRVRRWI